LNEPLEEEPALGTESGNLKSGVASPPDDETLVGEDDELAAAAVFSFKGDAAAVEAEKKVARGL